MESGRIQQLLMSLFKSSSIFENMDSDTFWGLLTSMASPFKEVRCARKAVLGTGEKKVSHAWF